ncbi:MAG: ABC transporter permease [Chitinophagaceae bacterium]
MLKLFSIEWMKVKSYRTFWVLFGGFIIFFPVSLYFSANRFMASSSSQQENMLKSWLGNPFEFPRVWQSSAYFGGLFFIMIGMLFIMLITNEVQYRTHRQNIIDGWSRTDFLKAKLSMLIFLVLSATLLVFLCGFWIGNLYGSANSAAMTEGIYFVGYFALMATMYLMVAFLIAILIKRTGLSIIIYFAFVCIIDNILWLIFTLKESQMGYFLPLESTDSLVPNPFKPFALERRTVSDMTLIITALAYILLIGFIIRNYFKKIDLKT